MGFDPISLVTMLAPVLIDGVKRVIGKYTGGPTPQTVDEYIQVQQADVQKLQALAQMDMASNTHPWVSDVRAMLRPTVVIVVTLAWAIVIVGDYSVSDTIYSLVTNASASIWFYLFGERLYMGLDARKR